MTLIVGIRCAGGIVVGADGAATLGSLGTLTAQQKTVRKLSVLRDRVIIGASGHAGLAQRLRAVVEDGFATHPVRERAEVVMGSMRAALWRVVEPEMRCAAVAAPVIGGNAAASSALTSLLVAMPIDGNAELMQFDQQCAPELATDDLPFIALGTGRLLADPFLSFVRRMLWPTRVPSVEDGIFSVVWTLRHAIETFPGGVADPIQLVVLQRCGEDWLATELCDEDIAQHDEAICDAEHTLRVWRAQFSVRPQAAAPEGPPP